MVNMGVMGGWPMQLAFRFSMLRCFMIAPMRLPVADASASRATHPPFSPKKMIAMT
jgi:hypothetical protein